MSGDLQDEPDPDPSIKRPATDEPQGVEDTEMQEAEERERNA